LLTATDAQIRRCANLRICYQAQTAVAYQFSAQYARGVGHHSPMGVILSGFLAALGMLDRVKGNGPRG
jgi:hypothetical protein